MNGNSGHVFIVVCSRKASIAENQQEYNACNRLSPGKSLFVQIWFIQLGIPLHDPGQNVKNQRPPAKMAPAPSRDHPHSLCSVSGRWFITKILTASSYRLNATGKNVKNYQSWLQVLFSPETGLIWGNCGGLIVFESKRLGAAHKDHPLP